MRKHTDLYIIIAVQLVLLCIGFNKIVFQGGENVYSLYPDGVKNYYTLIYYVQEPIEEWNDIFEFKGMAYPSVGNVFYTDNTTLISIPLRIINHYIPLSESFILYSSQLFFILCILLTTVVLYFILLRFVRNRYLIALVCLTFPILDPQFIRIYHGLMNLSLTVPSVLSIWLIIRVLENSDFGFMRIENLLFFLFPLIFGLAHIYYIPIYAIFIGTTFLVFLFLDRNSSLRQNIKKSLLSIGHYLAGSGVLYMILKLSDPLRSDRLADPQGYNFKHWRLNVNDLFSSPDFINIQSIFNVSETVSYESYSYQGSWFMIMLVFLLSLFISLLLMGKFKTVFKKYFIKNSMGSYFISISLSAVFCIVLAAGDWVEMEFLNLSFNNVFSPFYWLHEQIPLIKQFRALARFTFPVFFAFNLFALYCLVQFSRSVDKKVVKYVAGVFTTIILLATTYSTIQFYFQKLSHPSPFTAQEYIEKNIPSIDSIRKEESFDAILTLPAYYSGTGDYDYTIDPYNHEWMVRTMVFSTHYHIPMFNRNMARGATSPQYDFIGLLKGNRELVNRKLNGKNILIMHSSEAYKSRVPHKREPAYSAHQASKTFIDSISGEVELLHTEGNVDYYSWQPH